jgi:hypothetical protein
LKRTKTKFDRKIKWNQMAGDELKNNFNQENDKKK